MTTPLSKSRLRLIVTTAGALLLAGATYAQQGNTGGEWPSYAADSGSTKYTNLTQINAENFAELEIAWRWRSIDGDIDFESLLGPEADVGFNRLQGTPLMIDGVLYMLTALNQVAALDATSGEVFWTYDPQVYLSGPPISPLGFHHRGVAWWSNGNESRVIVSTNDGYLISLVAETGEPDLDFAGGRIDMTEGIPRAERDVMDWQGAQPLGAVSPPMVVGDVLVVQQITSNRPRLKERPPTWIRGFDVRSGELLWTFHTIPQQGEFGVETWQEESWRYTGNGGVWTMMSADQELGLVYLPTEASTNDFYGGHRPGDNLFTQSLVALDARTGERVWHFQLIHHGIWDYDTPAAPNLMDIVVDGRPIKAIAQVTKQGFTYVFDRATGVPVWPIEERPVPQEPLIPGERLSPTQPFPSKPPAFARQGLTEEDVIDFTPQIKAQAMAILENYTYGPLFTPTSLSEEGGHRGTILLPGAGGGANWSGAGIDPETATLFVPSSNNPTVPIMVSRAGESNFNYFRLSNSGVPGPRGLPILKPPYSTITAYDMNNGEILWQVPNGDGSTRIENNPLVEGVDLPPLGGGGRHPVLVTGSLLIHAQNIGTGPRLMARDKATGAELAAVELPANPGGAPMSYAVEGKQFIALPILSTPVPELLVLALPAQGE